MQNSINDEVIGTNSEVLLTSIGPTTEAIQERLLEIGQSRGRLSRLTILRASDGWAPFAPDDIVSPTDRLKQAAESVAANIWSSECIRYVLGKVTINTHRLGGMSEDKVDRLIYNSDILLVPGGNTWQAIKGLRPHRETIRRAVKFGTPYVGESAGSVIAGQTTDSADLFPADPLPENVPSYIRQGLGLLDNDIAVHAAGRREFELPGLAPLIVGGLLRRYFETPPPEIEKFINLKTSENGLMPIILHDCQALSVSRGKVKII